MEPLQPFQSPSATFNNLGIHLPNLPLLEGFLILVFIIWVLYTLVIIYHWFRYSHASWFTFPAVLVYLAVSVALIAYALTGNPRGLL